MPQKNTNSQSRFALFGHKAMKYGQGLCKEYGQYSFGSTSCNIMCVSCVGNHMASFRLLCCALGDFMGINDQPLNL